MHRCLKFWKSYPSKVVLFDQWKCFLCSPAVRQLIFLQKYRQNLLKHLVKHFFFVSFRYDIHLVQTVVIKDMARIQNNFLIILLDQEQSQLERIFKLYLNLLSYLLSLLNRLCERFDGLSLRHDHFLILSCILNALIEDLIYLIVGNSIWIGCNILSHWFLIGFFKLMDEVPLHIWNDIDIGIFLSFSLFEGSICVILVDDLI